MADFQQRATDIYKEVCQVPVAVGARLFQTGNDLYEIETKWTQKDIERGKKVKFVKSHVVQLDNGGISVIPVGAFQRNVESILESYSVDNEVKATLVKDTTSKADKGAPPQQFIEIWNSNGFVKSLNVKEQFSKKHGEINEDDHFSSFHLSHDGTKLLYIAEKKPVDGVSYFKKTHQKENDEKKEQGAEYNFQQSWGEQLAKVICPVVVVLDIDSEECTVIDCNDDVSCGRAQWVPNSSNQLVFVGYSNDPMKLGFVYCFNRRSMLYVADLDANSCSPLTDDSKYIYHPRFNPQATKLVFLENDSPMPYPHRACARLRMVDWATKAVSTVVDIISTPTNAGFTGIYAITIPQRCWDVKGEKFYYNDMQKSLGQVMCVDITSGAVNIMTADTEPGTYRVFDVHNDLLIGNYSSPCVPSKIFIAKLPDVSTSKFTQNNFIEIAFNELSFSDMIKWRIIDLDRGEGSLPYQAVFLSPTISFSPPPIVVHPHGGPHSGYTADFFPWNSCFTALGFSVLMINYNGSMGFGQDFIMNLIGKVGTLDIQDCQFAVETVVRNGEADVNGVIVQGGSHGGFISAHLIGQYPDYYKAAYIRNPVIDIAAMRNVSDIPDWAHAVTGLSYDMSVPITSDMYSTMLHMSPVVHASKIKASVILAIGGEDLRCPPSQGKELYYLLKALGKDVNMYYYPKDSHPLMSVDTDADCFMHCVLLFHDAIGIED